MENEQNIEQNGGAEDYARPFYYKGKSKARAGGTQRDLMEEIRALKAELEDSQFNEVRAKCRWAAAVRNNKYYTSQLNELSSRYTNCTAESVRTIKELQEQLDHTRSKDTTANTEEIQKLKLELKDAHKDRLNSANRLSLADKIIESLNLKLSEVNKKLQEQQLQAERDLKEQADKYKQDVEDLKAQMGISEATNAKKALDFEEELEKTKAFYLAQLEEQRKENQEAMSALRRAEQEKTSLEQTLQKKEEEQAERDSVLVAKIAELESAAGTVMDKRKRCWLVRWFSRLFKA